MNKNFINTLVKSSIYFIQLNPKLKETAVASDVSELGAFLKKNSKNKNLAVFVLEDQDFNLN